MMRTTLMIWIAAVATTFAGPYPQRAGVGDSTAIHKDDSRFIAWANGNLTPEYGTDVDAGWKTPAKAWGKATADVYDIVCLGNGGRITMFFPHAIKDGAGADFAVFENSFSDNFLELAFVEVSSDGVNFFRFPTFSQTANPDLKPEIKDPLPVGAFGSVDPTDIHGFAGKYKGGYGTPFDLSELPISPLLDKQRIRFVRIVDIVGDGFTKDSRGLPVYDPFPTVGSGGFDLNAIGVIHQNDGDFPVVQAEVVAGEFQLAWVSNPGSRYQIERSLTLDAGDWLPVDAVLSGSPDSGTTGKAVAIPGDSRCFWRVRRLAD